MKFPKFWSNSRNYDQIPEIFPEIDVRSFLPNFTEFPVGTEFIEFPVIPTEFNNLVWNIQSNHGISLVYRKSPSFVTLVTP